MQDNNFSNPLTSFAEWSESSVTAACTQCTLKSVSERLVWRLWQCVRHHDMSPKIIVTTARPRSSTMCSPQDTCRSGRKTSVITGGRACTSVIRDGM